MQQIASGNLFQEASALLNDEVGHVAKLAIVLSVEQKLGQVKIYFVVLNYCRILCLDRRIIFECLSVVLCIRITVVCFVDVASISLYAVSLFFI